jgi:predicted outer membrane repeat protein
VKSSFGAVFNGNTSASSGGAIQNDGGTVNMTSASFTDNHSTGSGGGAVRNTEGGTVGFTRTSFTGNSSTIGGAISTTSSVQVASSTFKNNHASQRGGAMFVDGDTTTLADRTTVTGNSADVDGGGIYLNVGSAFLLSGSTATRNIPNNCVNLAC